MALSVAHMSTIKFSLALDEMPEYASAFAATAASRDSRSKALTLFECLLGL